MLRAFAFWPPIKVDREVWRVQRRIEAGKLSQGFAQVCRESAFDLDRLDILNWISRHWYPPFHLS